LGEHQRGLAEPAKKFPTPWINSHELVGLDSV